MTEDLTRRTPTRRERTDRDASMGERLWLATLQGITARATHELRNAMNGAVVNLEVVRSRAGRGTAPSESIGPFAEAAAGQFAATVGIVEALVALARPAHDPLDVADFVTRLAAVLGPGIRTAGGRLAIDVPRDAVAITTAPCDLVRAVIGASVLAAADGGPTLSCQVTAGSSVTIRIHRPDGLPASRDDIRAAALLAGVAAQLTGDTLTLSLPARIADGDGHQTP
ncbi:MAG: hypothetical protein NVS1B4_09260 [Gemmatimonadaceae bacterium]